MSSYLRGLESEFKESTNGIRIELNRLEKANMLTSCNKGNRKYYSANTQHPLFTEIKSIVSKYVGVDKIIESIVGNVGNVEEVYIGGQLAKGLDTNIIDVFLVGNNIDEVYLLNKIHKVEKILKRKIRHLIIKPGNKENFFESNAEDKLLVWTT
ncbi:MAG: ArsR family transcriptional regulator [Bacteroidota bacterium]